MIPRKGFKYGQVVMQNCEMEIVALNPEIECGEMHCHNKCHLEKGHDGEHIAVEKWKQEENSGSK